MESFLYLETNFINGRTDIKDMYFTSPYKIMSPFIDGKHIEIMLMSASAGLLGGDSFTSELVFGEGSDVTYVSQSYDKVFNTKDLNAVKKVNIEVKQNARVKYMPYPVIPFTNSNFYGENTVNLAGNSTFLYSDIFTCGRTGMGEYFKMKRYQSRTRIYIDGKLEFADHTLIAPDRFNYQGMGMWGKYTHNGILYLYVPDCDEEDRLVEKIRQEVSAEECLHGVTKCQRGIAVRILAMSGDKIFKLFSRIADMV